MYKYFAWIVPSFIVTYYANQSHCSLPLILRFFFSLVAHILFWGWKGGGEARRVFETLTPFIRKPLFNQINPKKKIRSTQDSPPKRPSRMYKLAAHWCCVFFYGKQNPFFFFFWLCFNRAPFWKVREGRWWGQNNPLTFSSQKKNCYEKNGILM